MKVFRETAGGPPVLHVERKPGVVDLILGIATDLQIPGVLVHTRFLNEPMLPPSEYFSGMTFLEDKYNEAFIEIIIETEDEKLRVFTKCLEASDARSIADIKHDITSVFDYATNDSPEEVNYDLISEFEKAIRLDEQKRSHSSSTDNFSEQE